MDKIIAIDIDGTLKLKFGINTFLVDALKRAKADGFQLMLWSARGTAYAREFAALNFEEGFFDVIIGKPHFVADDRGWDWIRHTKLFKYT